MDDDESTTMTTASALWRDVCLASAHFHRAETLLRRKNRGSSNDGDAVDGSDGGDGGPSGSATAAAAAAEAAMGLYQSCHRRARGERRRRSAAATAAATAANDPATSTLSSSGAAPPGECGQDDEDGGRPPLVVDLELRMAQVLRFLALVHAAGGGGLEGDDDDGSCPNDDAADEAGGGGSGTGSGRLGAAIRYHDMAVSLLVGVFDEEEEEGEEEVEEDDGARLPGGSVNAGDRSDGDGDGGVSGENAQSEESSRRRTRSEGGGAMEMNAESFSTVSQDDGGGGCGGRVVLSIRVPPGDGPKNHHLLRPGGKGAASAAMAATAPVRRVTFLRPTEDQRVRAIAASLNALAELHARRGDDRAAMESYREALEILRAATEEEEEEEEEEDVDARGGDGDGDGDGTPPPSRQRRGAVEKSSSLAATTASSSSPTTMTPVQSDLAGTLMNVGNFHLRRDELDAALNAYSTVWALHIGDGMDGDPADASSHVPHRASTAPSGSVSGSSGALGLPLPHLDTPDRGARAGHKSLGSARSLATPSSDADSDNGNDKPAAASSLEALSALSNLGVVHERRGELPEALSCFEYVYGVRSKRLGREHPDAANTLVNIGNCRQRLGDCEGAGIAYEDAARAFRGMAERWQRIVASGEGAGCRSPEAVDDTVRTYRSLAGALRNRGTCYWKQRRVSEAIDSLNEAVCAEGEIVALFSASEGASRGVGEVVRRAKESAAQMLGLLGCLHLEHKPAELKSHDESEEAFRWALRLYEELGCDPSHPSVLWARHNLAAVEQMRAQQRSPPPPPPPPPPLTTPSVNSATPTSTKNDLVNDIVDLDDIDSVELDAALATDDENGHHGDGGEDDIFLGLGVSSTDELDEFLSRDFGASPSPTKERKVMEQEEGKATFEEEVAFDEAEESNPEQAADERESAELANKSLSTEHHNISSSLLSDQGQGGARHGQDCGDDDARVSQLHLQAERTDEGDTLEAAHAHVALAEHFCERSDSTTATAHYTEAHSIYQSILGDSKEVAMVLKNLGDLNAEDGTLDAARELYTEALKMELIVYGQYLPGTLNAAGAACLGEDDFRSAMEFHRRALTLQKRSTVGGGNKYEMYETLVRIGNVYYSERNNLSNIRSGEGGVDYIEFINSGFLGWIANAHDMRGEYTKAVQFYEESLQIYISRKGKEAKRQTALTLNRLGALTRELGRYDEAIDYHQKALTIQKLGKGVAKAMTAETCVLMGMVKSKMGEFKSALNLFEDSLLVLKDALGEDHSSTWKTMAQIGSVHFELSNYDLAMSILLEAERWQLESAGEENRDTLETQALIGRVLSATGKYEEALDKLRNVCERQHKLFGSKHPAIAETQSLVGECFLDQGMATEARGQFVECYNMRKHFFNVDQIHIAESMVDIIRARSGQPERALAIYRNAMEVYKGYLSEDHVQIGRLLVYEGDSYAELLNFSVAIERYDEARQIFHKAFVGEPAIDSAVVAVHIGKVKLRKCDYDSAKTSFTSALDIYQQILPDGHQKITSTLNHLHRLEQEEALCV